MDKILKVTDYIRPFSAAHCYSVEYKSGAYREYCWEPPKAAKKFMESSEDIQTGCYCDINYTIYK